MLIALDTGGIRNVPEGSLLHIARPVTENVSVRRFLMKCLAVILP
jgi:hypothetical protein